MTWINTKVEFEWDGEKYVETNVEGYEYEGELEMAQRRVYFGDNQTGAQKTQDWEDVEQKKFDKAFARRRQAQVAAMTRQYASIKQLRKHREDQRKAFSDEYDDMNMFRRFGYDLQVDDKTGRETYIDQMMDVDKKYSSIKPFTRESFFSKDVQKLDAQGRRMFEDPFVENLATLMWEGQVMGDTDSEIAKLLEGLE